MFGNTNFGFSGAGGGGGGGTIGGGGTLNYICKFTPDGLSVGNSMFFDNSISAGLGTITPDASSILDLTSTTQGFLVPRMTTLERDAIAAPVNALLIYNTTTSSFNYYNGLTWVDFSGTVVTSPFTTSNSVIIVGDNFQTVAQKTQGQINQIINTYVTLSGVQTLTNKRITPRVTSIVSNANPTVNTDNTDFVDITAQAEAIVSMTTNLSGVATNGQRLTYRIMDNGVSRTINWGASFEQCGVALPTTTPAGKRLNVGFIYDTTTSKWGCVAALPEL